jgi:hypothetical protein
MTDASAVFAVLRKHGLLLKQDPYLLNVVTILTGQRLRSSWWSDPHAHDIFRVLVALSADRRILVTKLVAGKDTLVHRGLWPALLGWRWCGNRGNSTGYRRLAGSLLAPGRSNCDPLGGLTGCSLRA